MARVLIIDDEAEIAQMLQLFVEEMGHEADCAFTLQSGYAKAAAHPFDLVLLDVLFPDGNGLQLLPQLKALPSNPEVIIMTGEGEPDGAELAIKSGAWEYIEKATSIHAIELLITRVLEYRQEKRARRAPVVLERGGIIGDSPKMKACFDQLAQAAGTDTSVLILGETGTGKELFAQALHRNSLRADKPFVVVDCAALPDSLVESVLFGHRKGAFTGADRDQEGLVKQADGGTLFLDEIAELDPAIQTAFLRVLQEHRFRPVGSQTEVTSDFRLVAATNQNLDELARAREFREDLLYRLRTYEIKLPSLRERKEDIRAITTATMNGMCELHGIATKGFSPEFFSVLEDYDWPGNVRELLHALERAFTAARLDSTLYPTHLPLHLRVQLARSSVTRPRTGAALLEAPRPVSTFPRFLDARLEAIARFEQSYLRDLMDFSNGHIPTACGTSALSRSRLYALLKKHEIER